MLEFSISKIPPNSGIFTKTEFSQENVDDRRKKKKSGTSKPLIHSKLNWNSGFAKLSQDRTPHPNLPHRLRGVTPVTSLLLCDVTQGKDQGLETCVISNLQHWQCLR